MSPEQYLAFEREAERKHEYWHGEVFAMAGASRQHNLLVSNLVHLLVSALRDRPCEVYPSDMRVRAATGDVFTYPDVSVTCGAPKLADHDTLLNPMVIIEVLRSRRVGPWAQAKRGCRSAQAKPSTPSPARRREIDSTEVYDRGKKFEHYRGIPSVQHYLLVAQSQPLVESYTRQADGTWSLAVRRLGDQVGLSTLGCDLAVAEIYRRVLEPDPGS